MPGGRRISGTEGTGGKKLVSYVKCRKNIILTQPLWEYNIKVTLKYTGCNNVDWIRLALETIQWRTLVNTGMIFQSG